MKILNCLIAATMLATVTTASADNESSPISGNGICTYQIDKNYGYGAPDLKNPTTFEVTASYQDGVLTIYGLKDEINNLLEPINFDLDLTTGEAVATNQFALTDDFLGKVTDYYYGNLKDYEKVVTGQFENIDDFQSKFTIEPWCLMDEYGYPADGFYNTEIIFDFAIKGSDSGTTAVGSIIDENEQARYFNINGMEVNNPEPGTMYIKVSGTKAEKVLYR